MAERLSGNHRRPVLDANQNPEDEVDRWLRLFEEWTKKKIGEASFVDVAQMIISFILAVAGIVALFIYGGQLREMKKATNAAQMAAYEACRGSKISQAALLETQRGATDTHLATVAAVSQAIAATASEYAALEPLFQTPQPDMSVPFTIRNAGKTSAIGSRIELRAIFLPVSERIKFTYPKKATSHIIHGRIPAETVENLTGNPKQYASVPIMNEEGTVLVPSKVDRDDFASGRKDIVLYGRVTYSDIFGGRHSLQFCNLTHQRSAGYVKDSGHGECANYNKTDTGDLSLSNENSAISSLSSPKLEEITCTKPRD